jgi:hypothetical protein
MIYLIIGHRIAPNEIFAHKINEININYLLFNS